MFVQSYCSLIRIDSLPTTSTVDSGFVVFFPVHRQCHQETSTASDRSLSHKPLADLPSRLDSRFSKRRRCFSSLFADPSAPACLVCVALFSFLPTLSPFIGLPHRITNVFCKPRINHFRQPRREKRKKEEGEPMWWLFKIIQDLWHLCQFTFVSCRSRVREKAQDLFILCGYTILTTALFLYLIKPFSRR